MKQNTNFISKARGTPRALRLDRRSVGAIHDFGYAEILTRASAGAFRFDRICAFHMRPPSCHIDVEYPPTCHPERRAKPEVELLRHGVSVAQAGYGIEQKRAAVIPGTVACVVSAGHDTAGLSPCVTVKRDLRTVCDMLAEPKLHLTVSGRDRANGEQILM